MMIDNITDEALEIYREIYPTKDITKQDIFYYVYGVLHHPGYRNKYEAFLVRDLPRIPFAPNFDVFVDVGKRLADLHMHWESYPRYDLGDPLHPIPDKPYKMKFGDNGKDHTQFLVNNLLVYDNLPNVNYAVNGHTPHGWLTIKLKNHPYINRYPFRYMTGEQIRIMLEKLIHIGLESDKIIQQLEKEDFEMDVDVTKFKHANTLDKYTNRE
ncbi:MAG: hypothetical protein F4202_05720 [Cenarchaeum sp. SB0677_bin_16]|nr:hypothetical protein [Cenarchaeum sp. SB0677_bin_16]